MGEHVEEGERERRGEGETVAYLSRLSGAPSRGMLEEMPEARYSPFVREDRERRGREGAEEARGV